MNEGRERRREERLEHKYPVMFSDDFARGIYEGLMVDVSSGGIAFTCGTGDGCPQDGQELTVKFSLPRFDEPDNCGLMNITRTGRVCRVDTISTLVCRVGIKFDKPLTLKPCEQASIVHSDTAQ